MAIPIPFVLLALLAASKGVFEPDHLFVADITRERVLEFDRDGALVRELGDGVGLVAPRGVAFGPDGNLYVTSGDEVVALDAQGAVVKTIGPGSDLTGPRGISFGPKGRLFVTSLDRVRVFDEDGVEVGDVGAAEGMAVPIGLAFDPRGDLYVAEGGTNRLSVFEPGGRKVREVGEGSSLGIPTGIAFGPDGVLHVASLFTGSVVSFDALDQESAVASDPALALPSGLAFGPDGLRYVSALLTGRVAVVGADGAVLGEIEAGTSLLAPEGLAFAPRRLKVKVKGTLAREGAKPKKVSLKATLLWSPGSHQMMLRLPDGALAGAIGTRSVVASGFAVSDGPSDKARHLHAFSVCPFGTQVASAKVRFKGKLAATGFGTGFRPKSASGSLSIGSGGVVFRGKIK